MLRIFRDPVLVLTSLCALACGGAGGSNEAAEARAERCRPVLQAHLRACCQGSGGSFDEGSYQCVGGDLMRYAECQSENHGSLPSECGGD